MIQWHDSEARADRDRVDPAEGVDQRGIFLVCEPQRLEGALEAVDQVEAQGGDTDEVDSHEPQLLEGDVNSAVDILYRFVVAGIGDHGERGGKAHLDPEVGHVETQEGEDQDTEESHILGSPGGTGDFAVGVFAAFGFAVGQGQGDTLDGV